MDDKPNSGRARSYLRISLKSLFIISTCICCYVAGEMRGRRYQTNQPAPTGNLVRVYECLYRETLALPNADKAKLLTTIGRKIKTEVLPSRWNSVGSGCRISTDVQTGSLIVVADSDTHTAVHRAVENYRENVVAARFRAK